MSRMKICLTQEDGIVIYHSSSHPSFDSQCQASCVQIIHPYDRAKIGSVSVSVPLCHSAYAPRMKFCHTLKQKSRPSDDARDLDFTVECQETFGGRLSVSNDTRRAEEYNSDPWLYNLGGLSAAWYEGRVGTMYLVTTNITPLLLCSLPCSGPIFMSSLTRLKTLVWLIIESHCS